MKHFCSSVDVIPSRTLLLVLLAIGMPGFGLGGCEQRGVEEHTIDKGIEHVPGLPLAEKAPADTEENAAASEASPPWVLPDHWILDPEPRSMRLATYQIPISDGADESRVEVAITRFQGVVGGDLANLNRWRGQMGLDPVDSDALGQHVTRFVTVGFKGYEAKIESTQTTMLAAGIYEEQQDRTWFVRAITTPEIADRVEGQVFGFARSFGNQRSGEN